MDLFSLNARGELDRGGILAAASQARVPKGSSNGGQFARKGGGSAPSSTTVPKKGAAAAKTASVAKHDWSKVKVGDKATVTYPGSNGKPPVKSRQTVASISEGDRRSRTITFKSDDDGPPLKVQVRFGEATVAGWTHGSERRIDVTM